MAAVCERARGFDGDVGGEQEEARGDQLLGATFCVAGAAAGAGEEPEHDTAGECLDHAVGTEADQGDRPGGDPGADGDRELDDVPADAAPGEQSQPTLEFLSLPRFGAELLDGNGERPPRADLKKLSLLFRHEPWRHALPARPAKPLRGGRALRR